MLPIKFLSPERQGKDQFFFSIVNCHTEYNAEHLRSHAIFLLCNSHGRCTLSDCTSWMSENVNNLKLFSVWLRFIFLRFFKNYFLLVWFVCMQLDISSLITVRTKKKASIRNSTSKNFYLILVICEEGTKCLDYPLKDSVLLPWHQEQCSNSSDSVGWHFFTGWTMNDRVIGFS